MFLKKHPSNINILINQNHVITLSPYSSCYSLKEDIRTKLYPNSKNDIHLYKNGFKLELNDSDPLCKINIINNTQLTALLSVKGGSNTTSDILWIIYVFAVVAYFFFLASGLIPFFANMFSVTFTNTIFAIIRKLTANKTSYLAGFIKLFFRFIAWILKNLATLFFVWMLTAYIIFPHLYWRKNLYCESALAAKRIGWWTMVIFIVIYAMLNFADTIFNLTLALSSDLPDIFDATISPAIVTLKNSWDQIKMLPAAFLPGINVWQVIIEGFFSTLYLVVDTLQIYNCDDSANLKQMCEMFNSLRDLIKTGDERKSNLEKIKSNLKGNGAKNAKKILSTNLKSSAIGAMGISTEIIKDYKLGSAIKLLSRGFCDRYVKSQGKPIEEDSNYPIGSFNRWSSGIFTSIFCQFMEANEDLKDTLYGIGTDDQVINMVKTGNIAGCFSAIYFLVLFIYTFFASGFAGFTYA